MKVAIIGNGIQANIGALYLRNRFGDQVEITRIGPADRGGLPVVGESTIEITAHFLEKHLHLESYLQENHLPKFALTYYFKLEPDKPEDRTYTVHCNERAPSDLRQLNNWEGPMAHPPSWQLNRETFDRDLRRMVEAPDSGIRTIKGLVEQVELHSGGTHELAVSTTEGQKMMLEVDWVIDCSGRNQVLARKLGLASAPRGPRDCFWFRLTDFDRSHFQLVNALGPQPQSEGEAYHYDRYYSTHHFMGRGNWIWMIPMKNDDGSHTMSIGISSHPDHFEGRIKDMDGFLAQMDRTHQVISDIVRSGKVKDTNVLRKYHYVIEQVYSSDRWAIVGDAAYSPDPLFSNGLAYASIQWEQIGAMIDSDLDHSLDDQYVRNLTDAFLGPVRIGQSAITNWYATMHDPFLSSIRLNWIEIAYFYLLLPLVMNGCHYRPDRLKLYKLMQGSSDGLPFDIPAELIEARESIDVTRPECYVYNGKEKVNLRAMELVRDLNGLYEQAAEGGRVRDAYTRQILDKVRGLILEQL